MFPYAPIYPDQSLQGAEGGSGSPAGDSWKKKVSIGVPQQLDGFHINSISKNGWKFGGALVILVQETSRVLEVENP